MTIMAAPESLKTAIQSVNHPGNISRRLSSLIVSKTNYLIV